MEQLEKINQIIKEHESSVRCYYAGDESEKIKALLSHYKDKSAEEIGKRKQLIEDALVYFRSVVMITESIGMAGTHAEKSARLRGLIELLNSAISKLRAEQSDSLLNNWESYSWSYSDYPYRAMLESMNRLKAQNEYLKAKLPEENKDNILDSLPF